MALQSRPLILFSSAGATTISRSPVYVIKKFLIRQLTMPHGSSFNYSIRTSLHSNNSHAKWTRLSCYIAEFQQFCPDHVFRFSWPPLPTALLLTPLRQIFILIYFYYDRSLPDNFFASAWNHWRMNNLFSSIV